jgi:hypothetical protein
MKVYEVVVRDYDLEVSYGLYLKRESAEKRMKEAKQKEFWAKKHPEHCHIIEKEIIES